MRLLHGLQHAAGFTAWIWATPIGANGRYLSTIRDRWNRMNHLYEIERGTLPEQSRIEYITQIEATDAYTARRGRDWRRWWHPWQSLPSTTEAVLTPLCGRLPSRSRRPSLSPAYSEWGGHVEDLCVTCSSIARRRGITPRYTDQLAREDPWNQITREDRPFTPDPLTGN